MTARSGKATCRRVAIVEKFHHILKQIHDKDCLHACSRKTYARVSMHMLDVCITSYTLYVQSLYSYIPRVVVKSICKLVFSMQLKETTAHQSPLRPIIADGLFSHIQVTIHALLHEQNMYSYLYIDLIDMRRMPHNGCNWILHIMDHWSKFNFAFPLVKMKANHVVKALHNYMYVFPVFGLPGIIHSDNDKELINKLIEYVVSTWPGHVQLISGRPQHSQSQRLVEQAHYTLERMIIVNIAECGDQSPPWSQWLPHK